MKVKQVSAPRRKRLLRVSAEEPPVVGLTHHPAFIQSCPARDESSARVTLPAKKWRLTPAYVPTTAIQTPRTDVAHGYSRALLIHSCFMAASRACQPGLRRMCRLWMELRG